MRAPRFVCPRQVDELAGSPWRAANDCAARGSARRNHQQLGARPRTRRPARRSSPGSARRARACARRASGRRNTRISTVPNFGVRAGRRTRGRCSRPWTPGVDHVEDLAVVVGPVAVVGRDADPAGRRGRSACGVHQAGLVGAPERVVGAEREQHGEREGACRWPRGWPCRGRRCRRATWTPKISSRATKRRALISPGSAGARRSAPSSTWRKGCVPASRSSVLHGRFSRDLAA